jgi:hypothetical protein
MGDTETMGKTAMFGAVIDQICKRSLPNESQSLICSGLDDFLCYPRELMENATGWRWLVEIDSLEPDLDMHGIAEESRARHSSAFRLMIATKYEKKVDPASAGPRVCDAIRFLLG